ncbi:MAG: OmpA family protein [Saprospiraceae bacterium]|nr:MAG: OmpA family protein [Saprospiraceae bacterium]
MTKLRLLFLFVLLPFLAISQEKWEGGAFLGYSSYLGDLTVPTFTLKGANPAFGIFIRNHISPRLALRMNLLYGNIEGSDLNYPELEARGASFTSSLIELSMLGEYEFFAHRRFTSDGRFTKTWSPYIFTGAGLNVVNPKTNYGALKPSANLEKDQNANYSHAQFAIPIGGGIKFDLSRKVNLGVEWGMRLSFSDYLDGIKYAGNPNSNDILMFGGVALGFRFGDKDTDNDGVVDENDRCPTQPGSMAMSGCPDADNDGIADREDGCPNEAGESRLNGCPDSDGDGVADKNDDCPNDAGLRRFSGCPDTDADNIVDKEDNCPTVPGLEALNGCPDADRDGITDDVDECPQEAGTAEHNGCPDSDNDGIADNKDKCPKQAGPRRFDGCPDTDNDGVDDTKDKCPLLAGLADNDGCPVIAKEDKAVLDLAMRDVRFQTGSAELLPSSLVVLNQLVEVMNRYPGYKLRIDGYTDSHGNDFVNQQLSVNRARACYEYLATKGISKNLLSYYGHGVSNPIADNTTATGRYKNRRVEFTLTPQ